MFNIHQESAPFLSADLPAGTVHEGGVHPVENDFLLLVACPVADAGPEMVSPVVSQVRRLDTDVEVVVAVDHVEHVPERCVITVKSPDAGREPLVDLLAYDRAASVDEVLVPHPPGEDDYVSLLESVVEAGVLGSAFESPDAEAGPSGAGENGKCHLGSSTLPQGLQRPGAGDGVPEVGTGMSPEQGTKKTFIAPFLVSFFLQASLGIIATISVPPQ